MFRLIIWLLGVSCALESKAALAALPTPCTVPLSSPVVEGLATRLAATDDRGTWAEIVDGAAPLSMDGSLGVADRACAAYVAGSAAFFLSDGRVDRRRRAADAVRFFVIAQALAPEAMGARQPRSRAETAWGRVGEVPGWLSGAQVVEVGVELPAGAVAVALGPADAAAWRAVCPDASCVEAASLRVPASGRVRLRPGRYAVAVEGRCGVARAEVVVGAGVLGVPAAAECRVRVRGVEAGGGGGVEQAAAVEGVVVAGVDGAQHDAAAVGAGASPVTVSAPGYRATAVVLPKEGGEVAVALARCAVDLRVETIPPGAVVEGDGPGPWGTRVVSASLAGHGLLETSVVVARPDRCEGATQSTVLVLPRPVTVVASDGQGGAVTLARLVVQGEPVDPLGFFRAPGGYAFQAMHGELGLALGRFEVAPCPAGACAPARLVVKFERRVKPAASGGGRGPGVVMALGGVLTGAGLVAGAAAWGTHRRIEGYETKATEGRGIDALIAARDTQALAADTLFVAGGVALAVGIGWWLWGGE